MVACGIKRENTSPMQEKPAELKVEVSKTFGSITKNDSEQSVYREKGATISRPSEMQPTSQNSTSTRQNGELSDPRNRKEDFQQLSCANLTEGFQQQSIANSTKYLQQQSIASSGKHTKEEKCEADTTKLSIQYKKRSSWGGEISQPYIDLLDGVDVWYLPYEDFVEINLEDELQRDQDVVVNGFQMMEMNPNASSSDEEDNHPSEIIPRVPPTTPNPVNSEDLSYDTLCGPLESALCMLGSLAFATMLFLVVLVIHIN